VGKNGDNMPNETQKTAAQDKKKAAEGLKNRRRKGSLTDERVKGDLEKPDGKNEENLVSSSSRGSKGKAKNEIRGRGGTSGKRDAGTRKARNSKKKGDTSALNGPTWGN